MRNGSRVTLAEDNAIHGTVVWVSSGNIVHVVWDTDRWDTCSGESTRETAELMEALVAA